MQDDPPLRFRFAAASDVGALHDLVESAFRGEESRLGWTTEADLLGGERTDPSELARLVAEDGSRVVLGSADDHLVAACLVARSGARRASLGMVSVRPRLQGRGIGRALVVEGERVARTEFGAEALEMRVFSVRAGLIAWYGRLGYLPTGRREPFDPVAFDAVLLDGPLEFVVLEKGLAEHPGP